MSFFTINLEDENGNIIDSIEDNGLLSHFIPPTSDKKYCCTKYINLWGDTVFNVLQMDDLILEILSVKTESQNREVKELIDRIVQLAEKCKREVHTYIKFYGD
jgi:hypothetical protein